ncbi:MAG: hypothetical protein K2O60_05310 [Ruminococcus sp.]|nr:hypothetical protein [Ruminococcus sp.]
MSEMREILFKAKRKDNGEWIEGLTLFKLDEHLYMFQTAWGEITYDLQHNITAILGGKKPFLVEVMPETVGRYTGLTDKNGVKIFEGDIVSFADCWDTQHKGVVYWRSGSYNVDCSKSDKDKGSVRLFTAYACGAEIIGNIHDGGIKI